MPRPSATSSESASKPLDAVVLDEIRAAISGIRFGSVEIVIHDSKVVLINRTEKLKVPQEPTT